MNIAISSSGDNLTDQIDSCLGKCKYFCIYNAEKDTFFFHKNPYSGIEDGAGTKVVDLLLDFKISKVVSRNFGSKIRDKLEKSKIQMIIISDQQLPVKNIMDKLRNQSA